MLVTVMAAGVAIGVTHTPATRSVVLAGTQSSRRTPPGMGAAAGIGLIGAALVLVSLPQLPAEKAAALRRKEIFAKPRRHR
jgi:hypothetical protein